jgi:serine/threonine protein kinase
MSDIFAADIFSDSQPKFSDVDAITANQIIGVLRNGFSNYSGNLISIKKSGAFEINSGNYRVDTDAGCILLKRHCIDHAKSEVFEKQQKLMSILRNEGCLVPTPILCDDETYLFQTGKNELWMAMEFVDGHFFSGDRSSIVNTARAIGQFHSNLKRCQIDLFPDRRYINISDIDREVFNEIILGDRSVLEKFSGPDAILLAQNRHLIASAWQSVHDFQAIFLADEPGFIHIDLHPHNILMQDDHVAALIDFDSLMIGPMNMMLGFCSYKLLRQVVQKEGVGRSDLYSIILREFLESFYSIFPQIKDCRNNLGWFALTEICRRLAIIFRLTLRENNCAWNHVMKLHINGIKEVVILFELPLVVE